MSLFASNVEEKIIKERKTEGKNTITSQFFDMHFGGKARS